MSQIGVGVPSWVAEELIASGLAPKVEDRVEVREKIVESDSTPTPLPDPKDSTWIKPKWFRKLRRGCVSSRRYRGASIFGPRGTGKTTAVHRLAHMTFGDAVEDKLTTFQAAAGCTLDDLQGQRDLIDGRTVFTPGPLVRAIENDGWLCIEEANMMHPGVFSKLNTLTDGSGDSLQLPDGRRLKPGKGFRVILCFNEGAAYSGGKEVNAALRDRLVPCYAGYLDLNDEREMLMKALPIDAQSADYLAQLAASIRASAQDTGFDLSPRALFGIVEAIREDGLTWLEAFEEEVLDRAGDPHAMASERMTLLNIAKGCGIESWSPISWTDRGGTVSGDPDAVEDLSSDLNDDEC